MRALCGYWPSLSGMSALAPEPQVAFNTFPRDKYVATCFLIAAGFTTPLSFTFSGRL